MAPNTVTCPECGSAVPQGRLSCPECGSLLAVVAGGSERRADAPPGPEAALEEEAPPAPEAGLEAEAPAEPELEPEHEPEPAITEPEPEREREPEPEPGVAEPLLQPSTTYPGLGTRTTKRAFGQSILSAPAEGSPQPPGTGAAAPAPTPLAGRLAEGLPRDLAGWTTAAGAGLAAVSFILPWATFVLGASGLGDGYFEVWGLANPANVLLMLLALLVLALVVLPNRVADWIRLLAVPLVFGGVLLGLAWPYLAGPYGPRLGLWLNAFGGILLVVGGLLALRAARHTAAEPHV